MTQTTFDRSRHPGTAAELVEAYADGIYRFAAMIARGGADSDDIAQETMLRAIRNLDRFDACKGPFEAWLWRIAVNVARDAGRASTRRHALVERLRSRREAVAEPDVIALQRIDDEGLLAAVRSLSTRPRTVIALRYGAQLSYAEIGAHLRISPSAATMAVRRALAQLRHILEEKS